MRPFWKKKPDLGLTPPFSSSVDTDLLAQEEEEAFIASVLKKREEREASTPIGIAHEIPEPDEMEWIEQEDVYRPQRAHAEELLAGLVRKRPLDLRKGSCWCLVRREAFEKIQAHLRSDTRIELGGLLMGEAFYDPEQECYVVVVEEALPAQDGEGTALTFAYTAATWQTLSPQLQALPANWTLLGSFHSHPGLGVFLSSIDLETQRDVFFHDWQIALVIDPISNAIAFFSGAAGHPCTCWEVV